jgi:quercetin dioxygenase-like cupin family protein
MAKPSTPEPWALDAELRRLLDAAFEPDVANPGADPAADERVKQRLLRRIAAECTGRHLTMAGDGVGWQPFGEGLLIKVLHESGGVMSYLLRLAPGASLPVHRHPVDEECVVLEGEVCIGERLRLGPGGFHLGRKDILHDRLHSPAGALIFLRGAVPAAALGV